MPFVPAKVELTGNIHSHYDAFRIINQNFEAINHDLVALGGSLSGGFNYFKTDLTGGSAESLDSIDGDNIELNERALVFEGTNPVRVYIYVAVADDTLNENSPWVIAPDRNAGSKRWVLASRLPKLWVANSEPVSSDDRLKGIAPGDYWLFSSDMWVCSCDSENSAEWIRFLKTGTTTNTACAGNDPRLPSEYEKAALAGTSGEPGALNRYVTENDLRLSNARPPTLHGHQIVEIDCGMISDPSTPIVVNGLVDLGA